MCQCDFNNCNKGATVVGDAGDGGVSACGGAGNLWEISFLSFSVNLKQSKNMSSNNKRYTVFTTLSRVAGRRM